ncbi:mechanosensitive ion channel family protein [candidate division KSB1 bacterium]|nr:mechanosensitive ion channel family protein [candidate division KSB1 bacterium]
MDFILKYLENSGEWLMSTGLKIFLIVIVTMILFKSTGIISTRIASLLKKKKFDDEYQKRADTLGSVIGHLVNVLILVFSFITILGQLGIEIGPLLAAAGIAGLAIGFGAQSLVKDVINGFFILLEDQIRVGDVVKIGDESGLVEKVNLKMTILRDLAGNVHYIPNGNINVVTNMTKGYSHYVFDIGVAYREDVNEVIKIIRQVDEEIRKDADFRDDILEPIEIFGLDKFADSALIIKARIMTKPVKQWRVGREYNRRFKIAFDKNNIEIPFPHVTLYMGQDKEGQAPPLFVKQKSS